MQVVDHTSVYLFLDHIIRYKVLFTNMSGKKKSVILIYIFLILSFFLTTSGCNSTRPVIIDGAMAKELENRINTMAFDEASIFRGNSVSNIRNGGNLIIQDTNLYVVQEMEFDTEISYYLQKIPFTAIGSLSQRNDILANLDGTIIATVRNDLYYIDNFTNLAMELNLSSLEAKQIYSEEVSSFRIFDDVGYISSSVSNNIYSITLDEHLSPTLLIENGGKILQIGQELIYTLEEGKNDTVINGYNRVSGVKEFTLEGGPFKEAEIAGAFVYFKDDDTLKRLILDDSCECRDASVIPCAEYAIYGDKMVIASTDTGMYLSKLDGSHIVLISEDKVHDIQLFDDYIFYKNEFDYNEWYTIQFSTEMRSALLGETISDGGEKFSEANPFIQDSYRQYYEGFIDSAKKHVSSSNTTQTRLGTHLLFVDVRDEIYHYYTLMEEPFSAEECDGIVIITNSDTILGQYTDGDLAFRKDTILTLFAPGNDKALMSLTSEGYPPIDVKHGKGDRYGLATNWGQQALVILNKVK